MAYRITAMSAVKKRVKLSNKGRINFPDMSGSKYITYCYFMDIYFTLVKITAEMENIECTFYGLFPGR